MILFRAENSCGFNEINAIVTPTTRGFRKILKDEDISFSLPMLDKNLVNYDLSPEKTESSDQKSTPKADDDLCKPLDDEKNFDEDDETSEWLQKMGLNQTNLKVLTVNRSNSNQENTEGIDNKPQSTILIEGGEVQALFNFLLNSKFIISQTGCLTGVPPTLISPKCFIGATLQKIKVTTTTSVLATITALPKIFSFRCNKPSLKVFRTPASPSPNIQST